MATDEPEAPAHLERIGREILAEEAASPNYRLRHVRRRRTGEESWEVLEAGGGRTVVGGLGNREEALRVVRGWERLSSETEGGLPGHRLVH